MVKIEVEAAMENWLNWKLQKDSKMRKFTSVLILTICGVLGSFQQGFSAGTHGLGIPTYEGPIEAPDPSLDSCSYSQKPWAWGDEFFRRIVENCVLSKPNLPQGVFIVGDVADDGKIYNVKIESSCEDAQLDADCMQAFASSAGFEPLAKNQRHSGKLHRLCYHFKPNAKWKYHSDAVRLYLERADLKGNEVNVSEEYIVIRKIPIEVLHRYPGVFTVSEILGQDNLTTVFKRTYLAVISISAARWQAFFINHKMATRKEIEDFSINQIDTE